MAEISTNLSMTTSGCLLLIWHTLMSERFESDLIFCTKKHKRFSRFGIQPTNFGRVIEEKWLIVIILWHSKSTTHTEIRLKEYFIFKTFHPWKNQNVEWKYEKMRNICFEVIVKDGSKI